MQRFHSIQDLIAWKTGDFSGIKARIRQAIAEMQTGEDMKQLLYGCTDAGGKMLRPLLMLMAAENYSAKQRDELLWGAAAGEMLHTASLLLDDILDGAAKRRGKPSVQAQYGKAVALCAGTALMATSCECLRKRGYAELTGDLLRLTQIVCDGEMLQDRNQWNVGFTEEDYMRSIEGKTASVFSFSCEIASRISGHDAKTQQTMREFGLTAGCLFQLRDDILDWTSEESELGKPVVEDFANGIYTLPAIHTFRSQDYAEEFTAIARKRSAVTKEELVRAKELVLLSGGIEHAKQTAAQFSARAKALLGKTTGSIYISALSMLADSFRIE